MIVDWTKPVEFMDGMPVRIERVLDDGRAIISWTHAGAVHADVASPEWLRNVPPKPREYWVPSGLCFKTKEEVEEFNGKGGYAIHVREVLEDK